MSDKLITTKDFFSQDSVKSKFKELLGQKAQGFITSVLQVVSSNGYLSKADPMSVYQAAAMAATLDLPVNNNLGFVWIVPYNQKMKVNDKWTTKQVAQFQMGYKGYIQLAQRSGFYKTINATDVREGEIKMRDRLSGYIEFEWIQDEATRLKTPIVGYISYFGLLNGFSKSWYMTNEQLDDHAKRFSQTYKLNKGLWVDDKPAMSTKTVLKLNISKYGPLSIDMQRAIIADQAIIKDADTLEVEHVDNNPQLGEAVTWEELDALLEEKEPLLDKDEFDRAKQILENKEQDSYRKLYDLLQSKSDGDDKQ